MTLNQIWKNCLRMWKWIDKVWAPGMDVVSMKEEWLREHMPDVWLMSNCFFCEYNEDHQKRMGCGACPGKLVSKSFHCYDHPTYHHEKYPKKFYKKLLQLDAKRRAKR